MFENLDIFRMSSAMAKHAGQRQAVVAQNVANSDTPGYAARDIPDFQSSYKAGDGTNAQRASRAKHLHGSAGNSHLPASFKTAEASSPNGNNVSLETEILKGVEAKRQHDRAIAIYRSAMNVLRTTIGK